MEGLQGVVPIQPEVLADDVDGVTDHVQAQHLLLLFAINGGAGNLHNDHSVNVCNQDKVLEEDVLLFFWQTN